MANPTQEVKFETEFVMKAEDVLNENGKRESDNPDVEQISVDMSNSIKSNLKKISKSAMFKKRKQEHRSKKTPPVWTETTQPAQILNELQPGLTCEFDVETKKDCHVKYICKINVKLEENHPESPFIEMVGDGLSKKDAKKKCAFLALCHLYPASFIPTQEAINAYNHDYTIKKKELPIMDTTPVDEKTKLLNDIKKRIKKFCNKVALQNKTPIQILHELCMPIAETGKCISETGTSAESKFTFEFRNSLINTVNLDQSQVHLYIAYGYGKNKKIAKQNAARLALKQFLDCDIDQIMMTPALP